MHLDDRLECCRKRFLVARHAGQKAPCEPLLQPSVHQLSNTPRRIASIDHPRSIHNQGVELRRLYQRIRHFGNLFTQRPQRNIDGGVFRKSRYRLEHIAFRQRPVDAFHGALDRGKVSYGKSIRHLDRIDVAGGVDHKALRLIRPLACEHVCELIPLGTRDGVV